MRTSPLQAALTIARQLQLFLSPSRQTFALLPTGAVPLWAEEFFDWFTARNTTTSAVTYNRALRKLDEDAQSQPHAALRPANLRTAHTPDGRYHIDLGGPTVHLTGKQWRIEPESPSEFFRPYSNKPLQPPTESPVSIVNHLRQAFSLDEEPATQLSQWLELALRPDVLCPLLVITGESRDQAASEIRNLIDPTHCAMMPLPTHRSHLRWAAVYNRVLAFPLIGKLTEFKRGILKAILRGALVRLPHSDRKKPHLMEFLHRPVILTAEEVPELCSNQIAITIDKWNPLPSREALAALLQQMVESIRNEHEAKPEIAYQAPHAPEPAMAACADVPGP